MNLEFNSSCRRKKHSLIHWNTLILLGLLVLVWTSCKKKRIDDYWNVESSKNLSDSWRGFTTFTLLKETRHKNICRPGGDWQRFKRLPDQIKCGQKFQRKLVKQLRIEKNRNEQKENQSSTMLEDWMEFTLSMRMTKNAETSSKKRGENWKDLGTSHAVQKISKWHHESDCEAGNCIRKEFQISVWLHGGISWFHKATSGIFSVQKSWRPHCRQRVYFDVALQLGT